MLAGQWDEWWRLAIVTVGSPLTLATLGHTIAIALSESAAPLGWTVYFRKIFQTCMAISLFLYKILFSSHVYKSSLQFLVIFFNYFHYSSLGSPFFYWCCNFSYFHLFLLLCGDIESDPGPHHNSGHCRVAYANIRGLYGNLNELMFVSPNYDVIMCSETLVSERRNIHEILLPDFDKPHLLLRDSRQSGAWPLTFGWDFLLVYCPLLFVNAMRFSWFEFVVELTTTISLTSIEIRTWIIAYLTAYLSRCIEFREVIVNHVLFLLGT